jgi:hypothetical protein
LGSNTISALVEPLLTTAAENDAAETSLSSLISKTALTARLESSVSAPSASKIFLVTIAQTISEIESRNISIQLD